MSKEQGSESAVSRRQSIKEDEMAKEKEAPKGPSRREFVKGAAVGGAGVAAGVLASCAPAPTPTPEVIKETVEVPVEVIKEVEVKPWLPEAWDEEADVVVVGYGYAGQFAAIEANDAGAEALILEVAPEGREGGSCRVSGQMILMPTPDLEDAMFEYLQNQDFGHLVEEDVHRALAAEMTKIEPWVLSEGGTTVPCYDDPTGGSPIWDVPGNQSNLRRYINSEVGVGGLSRGWLFFDSIVKDRGIPIRYNTRARSLVVTPEGEVLGVRAEDADGNEVYVKARRGVVLATGGFEANPDMLKNYGKAWPTTRNENLFWGSPYSRGDGITMAQAIGAEIVAMNNILDPMGAGVVKVPEYEATFGIFGFPGTSFFMVNKFGNRFINEFRYNVYSYGWQHTILFEKGEHMPLNTWGTMTFPVIPFYVVFDKAVLDAGPFVWNSMGWNPIVEGYEWSVDNQAELAKGWILQADTIADLAAKFVDPDNYGPDGEPSLDPATLEAAFTRYNEYCTAGSDPDFERPAEKLAPVQGPPFYGLKLWPMVHATGGGPKRDAKARVINVKGEPIPRLYSSGEMGTWWGAGYDGGCHEGPSSGRIAGANASAETPWA